MYFRILTYMLILCVAVHQSIQQTCNDILLEVSTERKMHDGDNYMTYVGVSNHTNVRCLFKCDSCEKWMLYWYKDVDEVYQKNWMDPDSTGPSGDYDGKVRLVEDDDDEGIYELEWIRTDWEDLPNEQNVTTWSCKVVTDDCSLKEETMTVEYFKYPYRTYYADGELIEKFSDVAHNDDGQLTCSVLSRPQSELTLWQGGDQVEGDNVQVSCLPGSSPEFNCSLVASEFDLSQGFECKVTYERPETGEEDEVDPEGCCEEEMYPKEDSSAAGLSTGAVVGIVLAAMVLVSKG